MITRLRWRLARWVAPAPIYAGPIGGSDVSILVRFADGYAWVPAKTFRLTLRNRIDPRTLAIGDDMGLSTVVGQRGRFVGTV